MKKETKEKISRLIQLKSEIEFTNVKLRSLNAMTNVLIREMYDDEGLPVARPMIIDDHVVEFAEWDYEGPPDHRILCSIKEIFHE